MTRMVPARSLPVDGGDPGRRVARTPVADPALIHELVRQTGQSEAHVRTIVASPLFQALLEREQASRQDPRHAYRRLHTKALQVYERAMDEGELPDALRAADAIADRVVPKKTVTATEPVIHIHLERTERELAEKTAREIGVTLPGLADDRSP